MPKNQMHSCGEFLKTLYYRDQNDGDQLIRVGMLYCPACNIYFIVDHNLQVRNITKFR